ncbi:glycosyltransferase family 2 protein [Sulfurovum sp. XTW-4]|uniref:Glycosyltransferase family 2 protein n=1 Tax=Sulfurovum xiamenensis TaxID=3019066 RepID=A0ABT7QTI3_9BACT|nr:glycosyltransferase family 2 protein [Sulfurovum xiamenensis]MDM5264391.1 glycosyltransferase family 2 protein [Sulfurovum xiamenensis]
MLKKNPLVSVIIPTHGRSHLLRRAIESVLNQTYDNVEIIIVDDNDSNSEHRDHTEKSLQDYLRNDQIMYLKHEKNAGGSAARNTGIKASHGKYIALLDDDDEWFPQKLQKQISYFESLDTDVGVIYCSYILQEHDKDVEIIRDDKGDLTKALLMLEFDPGASSTLVFRKSVLDEIHYFDEKFARHQDLEILIRVCRHYLIDVCPEVLLKINGHNFPSPYKIEQVQQLFLETFHEDIDRLAFWDKRYVYARHYMQLASLFLHEKMMLQVVKYYLKSILKFPMMLFHNKVNTRVKLFIMNRLCKKV